MSPLARYPQLILLLPYLWGLLLGPPGFVAWTIATALSVPGGTRWDPYALARKTIPLLMVSAGAAVSGTVHPPSPVQDRLVAIDCVLVDGPWPSRDHEEQVEMKALVLQPGLTMPVLLDVSGPLQEEMGAGDRVSVRGRLRSRPRGMTIQTRGGLIRIRESAGPLSILSFFHRIRKEIRRGFHQTMDPEPARLAGAIFLGLSSEVDRRTKAVFRETGTAHLLAISGLHLGLLSFFILWGLKKADLRPSGRFWVMTVFLLLFCLLTGSRIPVLRAFIVCLCHLYGEKTHRRTAPLNAMINAAFALLLIDPRSLFDLSFQLSFAGYAAIVLYLCLRRERSTPRSKMQTFTDPLKFYLGVSFFAWLGTAPLGLYYFHAINPLSPLINAVVYPFFVTALFTVFLHALMIGMSFPGSLLTSWMPNCSILLLNKVLGWFHAALPAYMTTPELPVAAPLLIYSTSALFLVWRDRQQLL